MDLSLQFTLPEILSLVGLAQCVYVLVYMLFRAGSFSYAVIPGAYFLILGAAFLSDASRRLIGEAFPYYHLLQWVCWFGAIPIATLMIFQIAQITRLPPFKDYFVLLLLPLALFWGSLFHDPDFLDSTGMIAGALSLLTVWMRRDLLDDLHILQSGRERFWLILSLIVLHTAFLGVMLMYVSGWVSGQEMILLRTLLGIAFVYIAATSLFRIYPQTIRPEKKRDGTDNATLSDEELAIALKIEKLFAYEKLYQEPTFGRAELARELNLGEATLSRIINLHFAKTLPQILSEYRVKDAQKLLKETDVPVQEVFEESGFNSMTTFNRVFKELTGVSPKEYRARYKP